VRKIDDLKHISKDPDLIDPSQIDTEFEEAKLPPKLSSEAKKFLKSTATLRRNLENQQKLSPGILYKTFTF